MFASLASACVTPSPGSTDPRAEASLAATTAAPAPTAVTPPAPHPVPGQAVTPPEPAAVAATSREPSRPTTTATTKREPEDPAVAALTRAFESRLTVWRRPDGERVYVRQCRRARDGCAARIVLFARLIVQASRRAGIDPFLVGAVAMRESGLDPAVVGHAGERGILQLHPKGVGYHVLFVRRSIRSPGYVAACAKRTDGCQQEVIEVGTKLLAESIAACGGTRRGLGRYNTGRCQANAYAARVLEERRVLRRLASET